MSDLRCVDVTARMALPMLRGSADEVKVQKVTPYWSSMADELEVWHDIASCPEGRRIPVQRLVTGETPPDARRRCIVCLFLDC